MMLSKANSLSAGTSGAAEAGNPFAITGKGWSGFDCTALLRPVLCGQMGARL